MQNDVPNNVQDKRAGSIAESRRQRERLRRISVGGLVIAGVIALVSCEGLTRRDASGPTPEATSQERRLNSAMAGGDAAFDRRS